MFETVAHAADTTATTAVPGGSAPAAQPPRPGFSDFLLPMALILFVFYFFSARPQQKRAKEQQNFLANLKRGDQVVTASGILGEVFGITDKIITLQVDDQTRLRVLKSQIIGSAKEGNT